MPLARTRLRLTSSKNQEIGWVDCLQDAGGSISGKFHPLSEFEKLRDLFAQHESAVCNQSLSIVDELESAIGEIVFFVSSESISKTRVFDVQIIEGQISFRWMSTDQGSPISRIRQ
jgi:hypothetical protein